MGEESGGQVQTLSMRLTTVLKGRLETMREVASLRRGGTVTTSDVAKGLLEAARDESLEVAEMHGRATEEVDHLNGAAFEYAQLKSAADNYKKMYQDLDRVTREEDINRSFQDSVIQVEESARPAAKQSFPLMWVDLALAFLLCGLFGMAVIILHDTLNTKLRNADDVAYKLPGVDDVSTTTAG